MSEINENHIYESMKAIIEKSQANFLMEINKKIEVCQNSALDKLTLAEILTISQLERIATALEGLNKTKK